MDKSVRMRSLYDPVIKLIKTHDDAVLPTANNKQPGTGDSGFDLVAVESKVILPMGSQIVPVGLTVADVSHGYWFRIEPRSGLGFKHNIQPHLGVIDNGYRGDLGVKLYNFGKDKEYRVSKGDKIAQLVVYPLIQPTFEFADHVTESARGDNGFGSSDNKYPTITKEGSTWTYDDGSTSMVSSLESDKEWMTRKLKQTNQDV